MAAAEIAALWVAFIGTHMGLSSLRWRARIVARLGGERPFLGLYSVVALALFVPMVWCYWTHRHAGPLLWYWGGSPPVRWVMYAGMGVALTLLVAGFMRPSPASLVSGPAEPRGAFRITRHPVLMAVGLFGLVHLLGARVHLSELAFFAGFPVFALIGSRHQDQRKLATAGAEFRSFHSQTPWLPFTGRGTLRGLAELPLAVAIGVALAAGLYALHPAQTG